MRVSVSIVWLVGVAALSVLAACAGGVPGAAPAPPGVDATRSGGGADPVRVSPEVYQVRLENDRVRVLEMMLPAGARDAMHAHPAEVVRFTNPGHARITLPDGQRVEKRIAAGEVMWSDAWTHQVENIGTTPLHAIIVELKTPGGGPPAEPAPGADPLVVSAGNYKLLHENDRVRVIDLHFRPGEEDRMHSHPNYVAYFVTPASLRFAFPDGRTGARDFSRSEVLWSPAATHQVANAGSSPAQVWIVEVK